MSWRTAQEIGGKPTPIEQTPTTTDDLCDWLESQPTVGDNAWLLMYAEDGVIWGKIVNAKLQLSSKIRPKLSPALRNETLIEVRLFGEQAEVHLWRSDEGWRACRIEDQAGAGDAFDEDHRLWGTRGEGQQDGFSVVSEPGVTGAQVVPLDVRALDFAPQREDFDTYRPLLLTCRHYLGYNEETGEAYIALSRLVKLHVESYGAFKQRRNK